MSVAPKPDCLECGGSGFIVLIDHDGPGLHDEDNCPCKRDACDCAPCATERLAAWLMWNDESIRTVERARGEARAVLEIADGSVKVPEPAAMLWRRMCEQNRHPPD